MVTIVTSLYDINRESLDGRDWNTYIDWFKKTLSIKCPMVIFVDEKTEKIVRDYRKEVDEKTLVITSQLSQSPYYSFKERMDTIIDSSEYKNNVKDPNRIECKSSLYNIVQYSKFYWLETASALNPFDTDFFLWLDAGISRFFDPVGLSIDSRYPQLTSLDREVIKDRMFLQIYMSAYPELANSEMLDESYLSDNRSYVTGGIIMGSGESISKVKSGIDDILENLMINKGIINNEQIALGYLIKKNPELFEFFRNYSGIHKNYEILNHIK